MNILYINGHPYAKSFHATIEKTFVDSVSAEHTVKVLALGKETFDPVLRFGYAQYMEEDAFITKSQELVQWADHIVFAFPMWWGDAPALMKGWIERVFTPGLTYQLHGVKATQLLKGRTSDIIVTSRGMRFIHWFIGNYGVSILLRNLFYLTGLKKKKIIRLGGVGFIASTNTQKRREKFLSRVQHRATTL